jgi:hypothetical protein
MKRRIGLGILSLALALVACQNSTVPPTPDPLLDPKNVYGQPGDPLPQGARMVKYEDIKERLRAGQYRFVTRKGLEDAQDKHRQRRTHNRQEVLALVAQHPELAKRLLNKPDPNDPNVQPLPDGNYLVTIQTDAGPQQVMTMGEETLFNEVVTGMKSFRSRRNQERLYARAYRALPETDRAKFRDPSTLGALSDQALLQASAAIVSSVPPIPPIVLVLDNPPAGYVSDPALETGFGTGGDQSGSASTCSGTHKIGGLWRSFTWPLKYYATSVKNQASRGSCAAFAVTAAMEAAVAVDHGVWTNLSEQALYNRYKDTWEPVSNDFGDGMTPAVAFDHMDSENYIQPFENTWNYNPSFSRTSDAVNLVYTNSCLNYTEACSDTNHQAQIMCFFSGPLLGPQTLTCVNTVPLNTVSGNGYEMLDADVLWDVTGVASLPLLESTLNAMDPVALSINATTNFKNPDANGYVTYAANETSSGNHAVLATGYVLNADLASRIPNAPQGAGGGYVIAKNSWGTCKADAGYYYLPFSFITDYAYRAVALDTVR